MGWQEFSFTSLTNTFLPALASEYWYFTAYFVMYMFIPVLNLILEKFNKKQMSIFLIIGFVLFSLFPTLLMEDPLLFNHGYSAWWLAYLYLVGASIKDAGKKGFAISEMDKNILNKLNIKF